MAIPSRAESSSAPPDDLAWILGINSINKVRLQKRRPCIDFLQKRQITPAALYRAPLGISSKKKTPVKERDESERARSRIRSQKNAQS